MTICPGLPKIDLVCTCCPGIIVKNDSFQWNKCPDLDDIGLPLIELVLWLWDVSGEAWCISKKGYGWVHKALWILCATPLAKWSQVANRRQSDGSNSVWLQGPRKPQPPEGLNTISKDGNASRGKEVGKKPFTVEGKTGKRMVVRTFGKLSVQLVCL